MEVIVDLQGFWKPKNTFVLKEVAILHSGATSPIVYQFAAPFPWRDLPLSYQRKIRWLERQYHGLRWTLGTLPYDTVKDVLTPLLRDVSRIYVKGHEKVAWLREHADVDENRVLDLEQWGCPSLPILRAEDQRRACAAENVKLLAKWLQP